MRDPKYNPKAGKTSTSKTSSTSKGTSTSSKTTTTAKPKTQQQILADALKQLASIQGGVNKLKETESKSRDIEAQEQMKNGTPTTTGGKAQSYFMGDYSLIRFNGAGPSGNMNQGTVWLVDPKTNSMRPFQNASALSNFFDEPVDINDIPVHDASSLSGGGPLEGYQLLNSEYAIKSDGTAKRLDYSASELATRYGSGIDQGLEQEASMMLDGFMDLVKNTNAGIDQATLKKLAGDDNQVAYYINALAYGGYTLNDIYRDMKKKELGINNVSPISATATRSQYQGTPEGQKGIGDSRLTPPPQIGDLSASTLNLALYDMPDEAFKTLVPLLDYNSDEFKSRMDDIQSAYHDILLQQVNAGTEQEKAMADYNWENFREEISKNYGIQLSNNAIDAWDQIEQAYNSFSERGIFNSGMQNESIDDYLRRVRRTDQQVRDDKLSKTEQEEKSYFTQFATPQQIQDLINSDPDKAKGWGLIPSDDIKNALSLDTLLLSLMRMVTTDQTSSNESSILCKTLNQTSVSTNNKWYTRGLFEMKKKHTRNSPLLMWLSCVLLTTQISTRSMVGLRNKATPST